MNVVGIDVSKQKLDCALLREQQADKKLDKVVTNSVEGVDQFLTFASKRAKVAAKDLLIVLEATGVGSPVFIVPIKNIYHNILVVKTKLTRHS